MDVRQRKVSHADLNIDSNKQCIALPCVCSSMHTITQMHKLMVFGKREQHEHTPATETSESMLLSLGVNVHADARLFDGCNDLFA